MNNRRNLYGGLVLFLVILATIFVIFNDWKNNSPKETNANDVAVVVIPSITPFSPEVTDMPEPAPTFTSLPVTSTPVPTATAIPPADTVVPPTNTAMPPTSIPAIEYSSGQDGQQPVLGPLRLPEGLYIATAVTTGFFIADFEALSGNCEVEGFAGLFNLMQGTANQGAQKIIVSEGCEALITISNTRQAWTLTFQSINIQNPQNYQSSYSSSELGLRSVVGPIRIPDGCYRVTATTSGFFIADLISLQGTCEANTFGGLFNLMQGDASTGAQKVVTAENCIALITIDNTQEPWSLTFEEL